VMSYIVQKGLEILYSDKESVIRDMVEYSWELVQEHGVKDLNELFTQVDVSKIKQSYMLPLFLRSFYAYNNNIENWLDVCDKVENELKLRGEDYKKMMRGNLREPYEDIFGFNLGPKLKQPSC